MDEIRAHLWQSWLIAAGVFGGLELISLDLIFAMLCIGALVGAAAAALSGSVPISVILALISAVGLLGILRPAMVKRLHAAPDLKTGHKRIIGQEGVVIEAIEAGGYGRVKVDGQDWLATGYNETDVIGVGRHVDIIEIKGTTAYVMAVPELDDNHKTGE